MKLQWVCSYLFVVLLFVVCVTCAGKPEDALKAQDAAKNIKKDTKKDEGVDHHEHKKGGHHIPHRVHTEDEDESWVQGFVWNVVGYLIIIIPSYFLIRMVKNSDIKEKAGQSKWFQLLQCCVFGDETSLTGNKRSIFPCLTGSTNKANAVKLAVCTVGLQVSYLTWGVLQEKVMTHRYGEDPVSSVRFKNSEFLVFMNRIAAFIVAGFYIRVTRSGQWNGPFYRFSFTSLSNICSSWCQYEALRFVSFPTQVLGKASKMIPVMVMGRVVSKKTYQHYEYVVALLISLGVSLFLTATSSDKHNSRETTLSGLILMIGYMGFDSFTSNWQSHLFKEYKISSMQMMFNVNCFSCLLTSVPLLISGGMMYAVAFMMRYPSFATHVAIISLTSVTGQVFIFFTIAEFGPLVFTTIMVTRSMFSILLSCVIYGHVLTSQALVGVVVVFGALFLQIYAKYRIQQKKQQQTNPRDQADMA